MEITEVGQVETETGRKVAFFVHVVGANPQRVEAAISESVVNILRLAGVEVQEGQHVFLGECVTALEETIEVEDGDDRHEPIDPHHSPRHHGHHHGGHIHCHTCHRIRVGVNYNGEEKHHRFSPAATVETARRWAVKKFRINTVDAETLILKIAGVAKPPHPDDHLGDLVHSHHGCKLACELVPDHGRVEG